MTKEEAEKWLKEFLANLDDKTLSDIATELDEEARKDGPDEQTD